MSKKAKALGALLITIADLSDTAETQGIVANPPADVLGPLVNEAARLGIIFDTIPTLAELHLAVEEAAQRASSEPG